MAAGSLYVSGMTSRRWLDRDILTKTGGGLAPMGAPAFMWFALGWITRGLFVAGALGLALFFWGVFLIGDIKNDWE
jgi:hypothetical protein